MPSFATASCASCTTRTTSGAEATGAEEAGFDLVTISDHFHPWLCSHHHSSYAWSVLGGQLRGGDGECARERRGKGRVLRRRPRSARRGDRAVDKRRLRPHRESSHSGTSAASSSSGSRRCAHGSTISVIGGESPPGVAKNLALGDARTHVDCMPESPSHWRYGFRTWTGGVLGGAHV